jgi:hypothetical protein
MPDVTPDRVAAIAAAARIPLEPASAARVADAVSPAVNRIAATGLEMPFETEPSSFMAVQQQELQR